MTYVLALAMVVVIVAAQWFFTSRALIHRVGDRRIRREDRSARHRSVRSARPGHGRPGGRNSHDHRNNRVLDRRDDCHDAQALDERGRTE